jgi:hypothetical protein
VIVSVGRSKHAPCRQETYLNVHEAVMQQYRDSGFVSHDTLEVSVIPNIGWVLEGEIACRGNIVVSVRKLLTFMPRDSDFDVQTEKYSYNVRVADAGNIFRYDNQHTHEGHADSHHKDIYKFPGDDKLDVQWVGTDDWPTLGDVLKEARDWHADNYSFLASPEDFVPYESLCRTTH